MSALCILGGGATLKIATAAFVLGWTHSVEKIPIEEDWRVEAGQLRVVESRIKGSGAGIEPGDDARLENGWFRWAPRNPLRREMVLRRSGVAGTGDWTLCWEGACHPLGRLVPEKADPVTLRPC